MSDVSKTSSSQHFGEEEDTESIETEDTEEYDSVAPEGTEDEIIFEGDELSGFYDPEEYISKPFITETCSLSEDALKFHYSFGYDCQQYYNLCVADEEHILFISGNLIHIFNVETKELQFRRSARGGGIGHIVKNPKFPHIAIGEKGNNPLIIVYHWPSFNIITVLRNGTKHEYTHLSYSSDGELLCSQGGNPDLLLTIWNWSKSSILLRTKAHGQDVINAEFSRHVPGHLGSSGLGHIKFWKMAHTFTGLKLQGELGRFGKTEVCDIVGIYSMPDEKVLSGSEWGNILVWALGSIKVEVSQRGRKNCHSAEISQIIYNSVTNEVITIGMDGWIKIWTYSVIDLADPAEDDPFVEMQPLFEVEVKNELQNAKLRSIVKRKNDYEDFIWVAQDYNGGLWKIDLNLTQQVEPPEQLLACHSGVVVDIASSPADYLLASLGTDGWIFVHNVPEKKTVVTNLFKSSGTSLIWLPQHVESSGTVLIGGFNDGRIRMFAISFSKTKHRSTGLTDQCIRIIQISKPHTSSVTKISLNPRGSILVTGSDDCTIFVYQINPKKEFVSLEPIGFVSTPGAVRNITWKRDQMCDALISCSNGYLLEVRLPEHKVQYTKTSYKLKVNKHILQFRSIRSEIERELLLKEIEFKKNEKLNRKKAELEKVRAENPGLDIDEEMFLVDSEEEEELPTLYYPEEPNAVLFAKYTSYNSIWLSVDGYDAGYIYEYKFGSENPVKSIFIPESNNVPIHCYSELENCKYLILGFSNGKIRIVEVDNERNCDFSRFWELPMHDNFNGNINQLCFSYDYKFLYSCGNDGNIFTYEVNIPSSASIKKRKLVLTSLQLKDMTDAKDDVEWSLEEIKKNEESENKMKLANARKRKVQKKLEKLKENYDALKLRNEMLPPSQVIPQTEFELDTRITEFIQKHIDDEFNLMKRKLAFKLAKSKLQLRKLQNYFLENISTFETKVTGIRKSISLSSFSHRKLGEELLKAETETEIFIKNAMLEKDIIDKSLVQRRKGSGVTICSKTGSFENYLLQISSIYNKLDIRVKRAIRKQGIRKQNKMNRLNQWREFMDLKPDINLTDSEDIKVIETAIKEIGDFKLKTDENYRVPDNLRVSTAQKYLELLKAQHEVFQMKDNFNKQLLEMQDRKVALTKTIKQLHFDLNLLHQELTEEQIKMPPPVPEIRISTGFSQLKFELNSADPGFYVPVPGMYDNEYNVLNLDVATLSSHAFSHQSESIACEDIHALEKLSANDTIETPWEKEMMCFRLTRKLFEQDEMLKNISQLITEFDNDLQALHSKKLQLAVEIKFLELFVLTLSEELVIIRSYSSVENAISDKITRCKAEKNDKMQEVNVIHIKIETKMQEVAQMQEKQLEIQQSFTDMVADNKFTTYLTRLFKKKKKVYTEESDSESSSTDDESIDDMYEDDEDSPDFIPINLGESICPPGCDHEVFTKTLALRKDRYDLDDAVTEAKKVIEILQKEHESHTKLIKNIDTVLQNFVNELTIVEREKQKKLNDVDTVVLLRLSQLQNMEGPNKFETLGNTLIFRKQMLHTLNCRVTELGDETENEKMKRKKYRKYLCNLDRGCKIMKERYQFLKKEVKKKTVEKFGRELDVEIMEQTVLRRMINDARSMFSLKKVRLLMDERVSQLKEALLVKSEEFSFVQRNNTKKIQLQTMLEEEITNIHTLLMYESVNKEKFTTDIKFKQYQDEIQKLKNVICNQLEEKKFLEHEIKLLKYKTLPTLHVGQMYVPYDKIVPVPEITVSDKPSKKESEEVIKSPFNICEEVIEYILEQVTINTVSELSKYDSDELKTVKSVELIVTELLNDIIISVEHSGLEEIKSSLQVTKTLLDELVKSSVPECMTSVECIALDVIQNVIDNLSDYDNEVDYLEITEEETNFDLIEVTSLEFPNTLEVCVNIIQDIINNLPI